MIYYIHGGFMRELDKELAYQVFLKSEEISSLKKQIRNKHRKIQYIIENNLECSKKTVALLNELKEEVLLLQFLMNDKKKERKIISVQIKNYNENKTKIRKKEHKRVKYSKND